MRLSDSYLPLIFRLLVVLALALIGMWVAFNTAMLWAYPFWVLAGVLLAFPLAEKLASPVVGLLLPTDRFSKPQPMYSIPESLRNKNELDAAFGAYQKIAKAYPKEVKPYRCMIRLAFLDMNNEALAESVLAQGMKTLKKKGLKEELQKDFEVFRGMTRVAPTAADRRKVGYRKSEVWMSEK